MIAAIMQPYFFPYIGYFQLMQAADTFVFHDDVQYIKSGWINRNRILFDEQPVWITFPIRKNASTLPINQRYYQLDGGGIDKIKRQLRAYYAKAPTYDEIYPFLCGLLDYGDSNVASFNSNLLIAIAYKLNIECEFITSSTINQPAGLKGQDKVIDICQRIGANSYINPIGGLELYDKKTFSEAGIQLHFLRADPTSYAQFGSKHLPFLSIIDVLMFNPIESIQAMLDDYRLIDPDTTVIQ